jgi:hypothetical protein
LVLRTAARKLLIDLSGRGIPLTCTKVLNQEWRGY